METKIGRFTCLVRNKVLDAFILIPSLFVLETTQVTPLHQRSLKDKSQ